MKSLSLVDSPPPRRRGAPRVVVSYSLWEDQVEALRRLSERSDIPQATLIRHAVQRFLADHESGPRG